VFVSREGDRTTAKPKRRGDRAGLRAVLNALGDGIIAIAMKVFIRSQIWAMADGSETLTAQLIQDVFDEDFRVLHHIVEAIAAGDSPNVTDLEDVLLDLQDLYTPPHIPAAARSRAPLPAPGAAPAAQHQTRAAAPRGTPVPQTRRTPRPQVPIRLNSLLAIVARGKEQGKLAYLALNEAGWIALGTEFFEESV
jgi:hypothetical protein